MINEEAERWLGPTAAGRVLGVSRHQVLKIARRAGLTRRDLPGCRPQFLKDEVVALAQRSITRGMEVARN